MLRKKYRLQTPSQWRHISSQSSRTSDATNVRKRKQAQSYYRSSTMKSLLGVGKIFYKIPEAKLKNAIQLLDKSFRAAKKGPLLGCHLQPGTSGRRNCGFKRDTFRRLLNECRECVLNQDWTNLAAILAFAKPISHADHVLYMPYFLKYAAIALLYSGEEESLNNFLYGVIGCVTDHDKEVFLNSLTSFVFEEINKRKKTADDDDSDDDDD